MSVVVEYVIVPCSCMPSSLYMRASSAHLAVNMQMRSGKPILQPKKWSSIDLRSRYVTQGENVSNITSEVAMDDNLLGRCAERS